MALCSANVSLPSASAFVPLRRAPHRPDPERLVGAPSANIASRQTGHPKRVGSHHSLQATLDMSAVHCILSPARAWRRRPPSPFVKLRTSTTRRTHELYSHRCNTCCATAILVWHPRWTSERQVWRQAASRERQRTLRTCLSGPDEYHGTTGRLLASTIYRRAVLVKRGCCRNRLDLPAWSFCLQAFLSCRPLQAASWLSPHRYSDVHLASVRSLRRAHPSLNLSAVKHTDDLVHRTRAAFEHVPNVSEKRMFGSIGFIVEGKLCVSARKDRIMCRIAPAGHSAALKERGCRTVVMKGRDCPGYVYVDVAALDDQATLKRWVGMALDHNRELARRASGACLK